MNRRLTLLASMLLGLITAAGPAAAQDFPLKQPIKIIVPVPPGGGTDAVARITAEFLQQRLKQSVVVENRPGASSTIGTNAVAKAPADGYTLLVSAGEFAVVPAVRNNLPYKLDDFTYLVKGFSIQPIVVAGPKFPVTTLKELTDYMKANPGKARYGSSGVGAIIHLGVAMFENAAGVKGAHVPYAGIAPVYTDLLGGNIDFTITTPPITEGLKVLASAGTRRHPAYPNAPTLEELGIKGATFEAWFGFFAPANLARPIADRLISEISAILKDPAAIARYAGAGLVPDANPLTGDAFRRQVQEVNRGWKAVAERDKIVVE